jgi:CHAD domain-containing protein
VEKEDSKLIKAYASRLFKKQVDYLKTQLSGVKFDEEIEFIHQTRVSSRRIRNILQVFSNHIGKKNIKKWLPSIRYLTKSLTKVRDIDVQIIFLEKELTKDIKNEYRQGINRILLRKMQKREKFQAHILNSISVFEQSETLNEIQKFVKTHYIPSDEFEPSEELFQLAIHAIDSHVKHCFTFVPFISDPNNVDDLHNMRIAIKNLRYTTEMFTDIYPDLSYYIDTFKVFQDYLGNIHDCDVWLEDLDSFATKEQYRVLQFYGKSSPFNLMKPGLNFLKTDIGKSRDELYIDFINHWNNISQALFWSKFRENLERYSIPHVDTTIEQHDTESNLSTTEDGLNNENQDI